MAVSASDVTFQSNGPAKGVQSYLTVQVRNAGTAAQQGLTVTVLEPSDAHLTGRVGGDSGIDSCVHSTGPDGRGSFTCQVHDEGPGQTEATSFGITADLPLPAHPVHPDGAVAVNGFNQAEATPDDNSVTFAVHGIDTSKPAQDIDLVTTAAPVTMTLGTDGKYHGTLRTSVTNRGHGSVPPVTLEILPPKDVTLVGNADDGFPYPCVGVSAKIGFPAGLRCEIQETLRPGQTFSASWTLTADKPTTEGTLGQVSAYLLGNHSVTDSRHDNVTSFTVTFAGGPSGNGQAAGNGSSLPVTGTPLALIVGGGAVVLGAGGALLVLGRRRRVQSPKI
jgi:hypothetical protein